MPFALLALTLLAADPTPGRFDGTWFFDDFRRSAKTQDAELMMVWESTVAVAGDAFTVKNFLGAKGDYRGKLVFDPKQPTHVDLVIEAFDLTPLGMPLKIPEGSRPGVFALDGDTLRLAFSGEPGGERPAGVAVKSAKAMRAVLKRAPANITAVPKEVRVTVTGPDGKPAAGVQLADYATHEADEKAPPASRPDVGNLAVTDIDGRASVPTKKLASGSLIAYDPKAGRIAYAAVSPASLMSGEVAVQLAECREVVVPLACPDFPAGGLTHVNSYLHTGDRRTVYIVSRDGKALRFLAPPGDYALNVYSHQIDSHNLAVTVPAGAGEFTAPAVTLKANARALMVGKPAPEIEGVVATKGGSVKLADYRGQYVVLEFWGYWCGPCIQAMPAWIAVHDKFAGKGAVVIGIHQDGKGEVATVAEYDAKIESIKKKLWEDRDLPFPVALVSGREDGAAGPTRQYAVTSWPTSLLIGPDGKVIGELHYRDAASAVKAFDALVAKLPVKK